MWGGCAVSLSRVARRGATFDERLFPALVLAFVSGVHVFGLIDTPTHLVSMTLFFMIVFTAGLVAEKRAAP
jgi:hypothetical protein